MMKLKRVMKPVTRKLRRHYGVSAKNLAIRPQQPWYWQALMILMLVLLGYAIGYWHFTGGKLWRFSDNIAHVTEENATLQAKVIQMQRQLQVQQSMQSNLSNDMRVLQDESIKLKQDVLFYKNLVGEKKHIQAQPKKIETPEEVQP